MKFPSFNQQVMTVQTDQQMARKCYVDSLKVGTTNPSKMRADNILVNVKLDLHLPIEQGPEPIENYSTYSLLTTDPRAPRSRNELTLTSCATVWPYVSRSGR
ncbi:hypothetical protein CR513_63139, partial [Mucuna pruriens]